VQRSGPVERAFLPTLLPQSTALSFSRSLSPFFPLPLPRSALPLPRAPTAKKDEIAPPQAATSQKQSGDCCS
jgi:hypothetical protein